MPIVKLCHDEFSEVTLLKVDCNEQDKSEQSPGVSPGVRLLIQICPGPAVVWCHSMAVVCSSITTDCELFWVLELAGLPK